MSCVSLDARRGMVEGTPAATRPARGADGDDETAPSTSATPLASAMRTPLVVTKRLSFSATTPMGSVGRTPGSGIKVTGFDELCAVCYSPLDRAEGERDGAGDVDDVKRELFTTECNHTYHRCCLVRCREADFTLCCLCKTGRIDGKGLTPEHVRERRALNAQRNAVIGAAARGREAVRARYVRTMVNRPSAGARGVAPLMPPVDEEGSPGTVAAAAPASPARSVAASSAPATPARGIPVVRGGYPSPAGRGGNSPHLRRSRNSASFDTAGGDDEAGQGTPAVFTTAAEELRARAEASAIAVAAAYSTTSAPTTPARHFDTYEPPSVPNSEMRAPTRNTSNSNTHPVDGAASAADDDDEDGARGRMVGDDADAHADAREGRRAIDLASVAAALGGGGGGDDDCDDDALNSPLNSPSRFSRPFKSAARELAELGESAHAVMRALIANGTASAPATPLAAGWGDSTLGRPAIAAAVAAAEAGGDAEGRAARLVRRLLEDE